MIVWVPFDTVPKTENLEQFLFAFRDRKTSDAILGDCDIAVIPFDHGTISMIVPRSPGTLSVLSEVWHLSVNPHYPYTEVLMSPQGYTGLTEASEGLQRFRIRNHGIEVIDIHKDSYQAFMERSLLSMSPYYVRQDDITLRFTFEEPNPTSKHRPLSVDMVLDPHEYIKP